MSFILDALKKSDNKRQESSPPRLDTVHNSVPRTGRRRPAWLGLLLAVLLLNAGVLVWLLIFAQPTPPVATNTVSQQANTLSAEPAPVAKPTPQIDKQPLPQVLPANSASQEVPSRASRPVVDRRIYAVSELPVAVQRRIPELHMSLHAFNKSSPSAGMIRVNEQILRQGGKLDGKILLEEIQADGAVFRFEGYRFLLPRR